MDSIYLAGGVCTWYLCTKFITLPARLMAYHPKLLPRRGYWTSSLSGDSAGSSKIPCISRHSRGGLLFVAIWVLLNYFVSLLTFQPAQFAYTLLLVIVSIVILCQISRYRDSDSRDQIKRELVFWDRNVWLYDKKRKAERHLTNAHPCTTNGDTPAPARRSPRS